MAPTRDRIKTGLLAAGVAAAALLAGAAEAATFQPRRGLNMDAWVTWPGEESWGDARALLPFPEWRRTVTAADLARLKDAGLDFVRVPVDPAPFLSNVAAPLHDRLYAEVREAVRFLNRNGLKAIVDLHLMPSGPGRKPGMGPVMDDPAEFERYAAVVRRMAETLSGEDPERVAIEPMNEPIADCEADGTGLWPEKQKLLWEAARAGAPKLTVVLTGACYSGAEALARLDPSGFPDANLIWTFHSYAPFVLTHQGATWTGDFAPYVTGIPFPPFSVPPAELERRLDGVRARIGAEAPWSRRGSLLSLLDELMEEVGTPEKLARAMGEPFATAAGWAARHGVKPADMLLGEFGMIRREYGEEYVTPAADRAAYVKAMAEEAEKRGFAWSAWSYGGAFGIVDGFSGEKAEPAVLDAIKSLPPFPGFTLRPGSD